MAGLHDHAIVLVVGLKVVAEELVNQKRLYKAQYYFLYYIKEFLAILREFWIISKDPRRLPKISEN